MATAEALAVAGRLKAALLAAGVPQVSIELQRGRSGRWVSSGHHGGVSFVANLGHHIASKPSASNPTPGLAVVKFGRPGLPGPLTNGYGGMDLIARIICLDWANHPGEGGPWVVDGYRIPRDSGRPHLFGWEHEGGYSTAVWDATYTNRATGKRMTYRQFMGACHAGTLMWLGRPRTSHGEHRTWADFKSRGRKIDRLGYDRQRGIIELTPHYGAKPQLPATGRDEDDMPTAKEIADAVWAHEKSITQPRRAVLESKVGASSAGTHIDQTHTIVDFNRIKLTRLEAAVAAVAGKMDASVDLSPVEELLEELGQLRAQLTAHQEVLERVADGQVTPDSIADELAERLSAEG